MVNVRQLALLQTIHNSAWTTSEVRYSYYHVDLALGYGTTLYDPFAQTGRSYLTSALSHQFFAPWNSSAC